MSIFLDESNFFCDMESMFDAADEHDIFIVKEYSIEQHFVLERALDEGYCNETFDAFKCQITKKGKIWRAEYKIEQERLNSLALHAVD